ncbi:MAG: hypothetical protein UU73_C0002G0156 [Candidatus Daviesbacteria bacterium GW2011_GWA1_41_61]|uniref:DOT1 domain-containing protein n=1 Tax=Candidatus Daviesbacteria bacterium GW2011_GWA2_40_9 TaxID=1618424 RepID=A0A0G0U2W1_9BACT|nr:MAG: hypothetical protein UU26_C0009G0046 [Candidatus Daviesbacteria bacterium GW2011_GWC1_40_9]KKR83434.1 MAG: hypothetical protein UU29_C0005G0015 [Candidatus Daviesbacteria bacterium GW2011_GWA2_40_9]KKR93816.1 MAG: hypothetical protein UU44_C0001G0156 [Candidatus Daviesbacteria bacterium GW2011_GWB1_41_15]KKS15282.1 MAG: hypothetical protein UU73_C0002G0156 [Candidatus Daviesbacteria bacterium GW2011_GWA1_41_61]
MDSIFILTLFLLLVCFLALSWFAGTDAPFIPTKMHSLQSIFKRAGLKKGKNFYELGSGDGRVVLKAAATGAQAYGIEQSWLRVWFSRYQASKLKLPNAHFFHGNIFDRSYYPADIVYIYLLPKALDKLEGKLKKELNKRSVVITQTYHFKNWQPFTKINNFYFYRV